jgi:hypothetical protein
MGFGFLVLFLLNGQKKGSYDHPDATPIHKKGQEQALASFQSGFPQLSTCPLQFVPTAPTIDFF